MKPHLSETSKQAAFFVLLVVAGAAIGWLLIPMPKEAPPAGGNAAGDGAGPAGALGRGQVAELDQATFDQQVLVSPVPVLVEFYADWCVPCQQLAPALEELARETSNARVVRVNLDENSVLADRYNVTAIPRLLVFKDGQVVADTTGAVGKSQLKAMLGL